VPVVCGFVGRSPSGRITTLGRGGSDTTAVILARCLGADELILVKDVEGVYTADPHRVKDAKLIETLEARDAHVLASAGAKFIHSKVFRYKPDDLNIRIVSSSGGLNGNGTLITGTVPRIEVETYSKPVTELTIVGDTLSDPEALTRISNTIKEKDGSVLSILAIDTSTKLVVDLDPTSILNIVHSQIESKSDLKAVSVSEGHALITVWGSSLDSELAVANAVSQLSKAGIDAHSVLVGKSSVSLLSSWEKCGEISLSIEKMLKEV
jgi:aspartate kinase